MLCHAGSRDNLIKDKEVGKIIDEMGKGKERKKKKCRGGEDAGWEAVVVEGWETRLEGR